MKKINGFWTDSNANKWDCDIYTEAQAIKYSESLTGCVNCINCSNCSGCSGCIDCGNCRDCINCSDCRYCRYCRYCSGCIDCGDCSSCGDCNYCSDCSGCIDCGNCSGCIDCRYCSDCNYCRDCSGYKSNPNRVCKELQGSVKELAQVYWIGKDIQIVFSCWKGETLKKFEEKIEERVTDPENKKLFLDFIKVAKYNIKNL